MSSNKEYDAAYDRAHEIFKFILPALSSGEGDTKASMAGYWAGMLCAMTDHIGHRGGLQFTQDILEVTLDTIKELREAAKNGS